MIHHSFLAVMAEIAAPAPLDAPLAPVPPPDADERLQHVLMTSAAAIAWEWHIAQRKIVGDARFAALYRISDEAAAEGVPPDVFFSIIHPQDRPRIRLAVGGMLGGAEVFSKEFRLLLADGTVRWVHGRGHCHYDTQERPTRFSGALIDITEQKRAEEHLRIAQAAGGIGAFEYVDGFGTVSVSAEFCRLLGLHPARELPVRTVNALVDASDPPIIRRIEAADGGIAMRQEVRVRRADTGELRWLIRCGEYLRDSASSGWRFSGAIYDITDAKRIESELRALSQTLEARVEERTHERDMVWRTSRDLLVIGDDQLVFRGVNPAWTTTLGHAADELIGRPLDALVHPEDRAVARLCLDELAIGSPVHDVDMRMAAKDGTYRWFSWQCIPENGRIYGAGRDITDRKHLEEQLRQSQKMDAVGQLTGGLAHDFNNLLASITGSLDLLQTRVAQGRTQELERYLVSAQGAARRAAALTHRLLAFSRRQTLDPRVTHINRLIAGMEDLIRRTTGPAIETVVLGEYGLWTTLVDPNQLENALLNLCINARDAMPDGGLLTIQTGNAQLDEAAARQHSLPPGDYVSLSVTDTGTGMTPDVIKRAFDPFFTTKPIGQGTGLGLSMIYGFARQSGGEIRIESELGQGTTMRLYLPRHRGEQPERESPDERSGPFRSGQGETVLVVDDEPSVRMVVTEVLQDLDYHALEATDGAAALAILESGRRIDLLVTDVGLPGGINGRQVADAARTARPGLKVLFITGYAESAAIGNGHLSPGMQVLSKPFTMDALARRVAELMPRR